MELTPGKEKNKGRWWKLLLKIAITVICLWYVSGKIDFEKAGLALKNANWIYLLAALFLFVISKLLSAARLNIYFKNIGIYLGEWENIKLYWLGMFYNLFLPGSISGDAYKVVLLSKTFDIPYKKTTAAVLLDRFSGLVGLGLILAVYGILVLNNTLLKTGLAGAIMAVLLLWFIIRSKMKDFTPGFFPTLILGIAVQSAQVISVYLIMKALNIPFNNTAYIFLFLVSSVVSVLPLTIGGLGAREIVFLEGSSYFGLLQETSVVISLLFYLITLFTSAFGIWYVFKSPFQKEKDPIMGP